MQITRSIRRTIASILLTAGLAYPACAAVCPKGIGGCTSPGRCFLFVDADGNSLCDYTARTVSQSSTGPVSWGQTAPVNSPASVQVTAAPVADPVSVSGTISPATTQVSAPATTHSVTTVITTPDNTTAVIQSTPTGNVFDALNLSASIAETALFLLFAGIFFALIRTGLLGVRIEKTLPALALSSLFALGFSLIATSFIAGASVAGTTYALIYMGAGSLLAAYLWHAGVMTRRIVLGVAGLSTLTGFVFLAPIMPMELGGIVNVVTGVSPLNVGIMVICAVIALTLLLGRTFCGQICPVGSLQELVYALPVTKFVIRHTTILVLIRLVVFVATVAAALFLIDLMAFTGLYDLFSLTVSALLLVAAAIMLLSVFVYRPVCRILCPFGVLFSILAEFSVFRLGRTETCISCRKCEKTCPAKTAGKYDSKAECYLCGRCTEICPANGALEYGRPYSRSTGHSSVNLPVLSRNSSRKFSGWETNRASAQQGRGDVEKK